MFDLTFIILYYHSLFNLVDLILILKILFFERYKKPKTFFYRPIEKGVLFDIEIFVTHICKTTSQSNMVCM